MQFLMIARVPSGTPMEQVMPHVKAKAQAVWQKYSAGIIRSIHYFADMGGAVMMCEAPDLQTVETLASELPMVTAGVLQVEIIALKPFTGFASLFESST